MWVKTLPRRKDTTNNLKERIVGASLVREVLQDNFQTIRNASFCSEKEYSHVENIPITNLPVNVPPQGQTVQSSDCSMSYISGSTGLT